MNYNHDHLERSILGALMGENALLATADLYAVTETSFADQRRGAIFRTIREMIASGLGADLPMVSDRLPSLALEVAECDNAGISARVAFRSCLQRLKAAEAERMIAGGVQKIIAEARAVDADPEKVAADLAALAEAARTCASGHDRPTLAETAAEVRRSMVESEPPTFPMFPEFTEAGRRFRIRAGEMTVLAASTGRGKTALCCASAVTQLLAGHRVAYFCTESSTGDIVARLAAAASGIPHYIPRRDPESLQRFGEALEYIGKLGDWLTVDGNDHGLITAGRIRARLRALPHPPDVVYVDFLQNLAPDRRGRTGLEEVNAAVQALHETAIENRCAMVICSQFNRASEMAAAAGKIPASPSLDWLKDTSLIAQLAHTVAVVWHDRQKDEDRIKTLKTRNLRPFDLRLEWDGVKYTSGTGTEEAWG